MKQLTTNVATKAKATTMAATAAGERGLSDADATVVRMNTILRDRMVVMRRT